MTPLYTIDQYNETPSLGFLPIKCEQCLKKFMKQKNEIQKVLAGKSKSVACKYCSKECSYKAKIVRKQVLCKNCNKIFEKEPCKMKKSLNHFCSLSCSAKFSNANKTTGTNRSKLEKWIEEQLKNKYPNLIVNYNHVLPEIGLELDIYIPKHKIAFELNGIFHFEPIYGNIKLSSVQERDQRKFQKCIANNISLCVIDVSAQKYFKPSTSYKYLSIITDIIDKY